MKISFNSIEYGKKYLAPSLLAADFSSLGKDISETEAGGARVLHIDVMDGHFVPNISMGPPVIQGIRKGTAMVFDTHLMISQPLKYIGSFARSGSDHITFHYESEDAISDIISEIRRNSMSVGISIKPGTKPEVLLPYLSQIDLILVMTVEPGFGGQAFMAGMIPKISFLRNAIDKSGSRVFLQVDGGIDETSIGAVSKAGADVFVAGTSVFRYPGGIRAALKNLESKF